MDILGNTMVTLNRSVVTVGHTFMAKGLSVPGFGNGETETAALRLCAYAKCL